jgi:hypothetical protein
MHWKIALMIGNHISVLQSQKHNGGIETLRLQSATEDRLGWLDGPIYKTPIWVERAPIFWIEQKEFMTEFILASGHP